MKPMLFVAIFSCLNSSTVLAEAVAHQHTMPTTMPISEQIAQKTEPTPPTATEVQTMQEILKTMQVMVQKMDTLTEKLSTQSPTMDHSTMEKPVTPMRGKEHEMRHLLQQIGETQDATEKKQLMRAHLRSMQEMMDMMDKPTESAMTEHSAHSDHTASHDMSGGDDMMSKMMAKMENMQKMKGMEKANPQAMEQRLNTLQLLLEQLLQHQILQETMEK